MTYFQDNQLIERECKNSAVTAKLNVPNASAQTLDERTAQP